MIFIDSSAFIALVGTTDKFHLEATDWWNHNHQALLYTSNLIFIESLGWIRNKYGKKVAVDFGRNFFGGDIRIERVSLPDEDESWKFFQKKDGRSLSMIDCSSIILMKRLKIKDIFTFDQGFQKFGFKLLPS